MFNLSNATSTLTGIFSLDVATAGLGLLLFLSAAILFIDRISDGKDRGFTRISSSGALLKTTFATHLFNVPALLCLTIAYACLTVMVVFQIEAGIPFSINVAYSYPYAPAQADGTAHRSIISILSFAYELTAILETLCLTGAVWLHSSHLAGNGTGTNSPGTISKIWNSFVLTCILAFGGASWGYGWYERGSGNTALTFADTINANRIVRILYIVYRAVVVFSSTSVSIGVFRSLSRLLKKGRAGKKERPLLARFTLVVVPVTGVRNAFTIASIAMLYIGRTGWSDIMNRALAFLFIVFGQLSDLLILAMVLWGARSMGRSKGRHSSGVRRNHAEDSSGTSSV